MELSPKENEIPYYPFITDEVAVSKETARVLTLGQGDVGQLGLGEDILERKKPALVKSLEGLDIVQVECGGMHTVALSDDGKVQL